MIARYAVTSPFPTFQTSSPFVPQPVASGLPMQTPLAQSGPSAGPGVTGPSRVLNPLWNALSIDMSQAPKVSFKQALKTHLFKLSSSY